LNQRVVPRTPTAHPNPANIDTKIELQVAHLSKATAGVADIIAGVAGVMDEIGNSINSRSEIQIVPAFGRKTFTSNFSGLGNESSLIMNGNWNPLHGESP
jgi:hypothetical protein